MRQRVGAVPGWAAAAIGATTEVRRRAAVEAQRDWSGWGRSVFDEEHRRHGRVAAELAPACRSAGR